MFITQVICEEKLENIDKHISFRLFYASVFFQPEKKQLIILVVCY